MIKQIVYGAWIMLAGLIIMQFQSAVWADEITLGMSGDPYALLEGYEEQSKTAKANRTVVDDNFPDYSVWARWTPEQRQVYMSTKLSHYDVAVRGDIEQYLNGRIPYSATYGSYCLAYYLTYVDAGADLSQDIIVKLNSISPINRAVIDLLVDGGVISPPSENALDIFELDPDGYMPEDSDTLQYYRDQFFENSSRAENYGRKYNFGNGYWIHLEWIETVPHKLYNDRTVVYYHFRAGRNEQVIYNSDNSFPDGVLIGYSSDVHFDHAINDFIVTGSRVFSAQSEIYQTYLQAGYSSGGFTKRVNVVNDDQHYYWCVMDRVSSRSTNGKTYIFLDVSYDVTDMVNGLGSDGLPNIEYPDDGTGDDPDIWDDDPIFNYDPTNNDENTFDQTNMIIEWLKRIYIRQHDQQVAIVAEIAKTHSVLEGFRYDVNRQYSELNGKFSLLLKKLDELKNGGSTTNNNTQEGDENEENSLTLDFQTFNDLALEIKNEKDKEDTHLATIDGEFLKLKVKLYKKIDMAGIVRAVNTVTNAILGQDVLTFYSNENSESYGVYAYPVNPGPDLGRGEQTKKAGNSKYSDGTRPSYVVTWYGTNIDLFGGFVWVEPYLSTIKDIISFFIIAAVVFMYFRAIPTLLGNVGSVHDTIVRDSAPDPEPSEWHIGFFKASGEGRGIWTMKK